MARIVKNVRPLRKGGRKPKYPWTKWFDGRQWELVRYVDFHTTPDHLETLIRRTAKQRCLKVTVYHRTAKVKTPTGHDQYPSLVIQVIKEADAA